jgi:hypothetical protein
MATICAMLSVDNIYFYPKRLRSDQRRAEEQQQQRDNANSERNVNLAQEMEKHEAVDAHMRLWKSEGDHFTLLNIYNKWTEAGPKINRSSSLIAHRMHIDLVRGFLRSILCSEDGQKYSVRTVTALLSLTLSSTPLRSQLVGEANDLIDRSTRRPVQEDNDQHTEGTASQRDENSLSQRKRSRVPSQDSSSGNQSKNTKRSRRDLETAIKRCLVAGLYMNAARFLSHLLPSLCPLMTIIGAVSTKLPIARCLSKSVKTTGCHRTGNYRIS